MFVKSGQLPGDAAHPAGLSKITVLTNVVGNASESPLTQPTAGNVWINGLGGMPVIKTTQPADS